MTGGQIPAHTHIHTAAHIYPATKKKEYGGAPLKIHKKKTATMFQIADVIKICITYYRPLIRQNSKPKELEKFSRPFSQKGGTLQLLQCTKV